MERNQVTLEPEVMDQAMNLAQAWGQPVEKVITSLIESAATDESVVVIPTDLETAAMFNILAALEAQNDLGKIPATVLFERLVRSAARAHQIERLRHGTELHPDLPRPELP